MGMGLYKVCNDVILKIDNRCKNKLKEKLFLSRRKRITSEGGWIILPLRVIIVGHIF